MRILYIIGHSNSIMFILIDKPKGMTSHDVVDVVRKISGEKRVGHAGTLDPNATGLLIIGIGRESTKKLGDLSQADKTYIAEITLGESRDTDDSEGVIVNTSKGTLQPERSEIISALNEFLGKQKQIPPKFSAIKVGGRKAYDLARSGKSLEFKPRDIEINKTTLLDYNYPVLKVEFEVSKGTYIRAIARDIGEKLGTYGYLSTLRRTKIGKFEISNAVDLDGLTKEKILDHSF